jgi:hypothetical protein
MLLCLLFSFDRLTDVETREDFFLRTSKATLSHDAGCEYWTLALYPRAGCRCRISCPGERKSNSCEKFLVVKRLEEKGRRTCRQGGGTNQRVVFSGEDDDARRRRKLVQSRLNFQTVHERHPNIHHRDGGPMSPGVNEKPFRIAEGFGMPASRLQQPTQTLQHRRVIVEKANNAGG